MGATSHDDVVDEWRTENQCRPRYQLRESDVLVARLGVTARMIVNEDERAGGFAQRGPQDVARVHRAAVQASFGHPPCRAQAITAVEREHPKLLVIEGRKPYTGPSCYLGGRREIQTRSAARSDEHASAELESCCDTRRLGEPDARRLGQRVGTGPRQPHQAAPLLEQVGADSLDGPSFFSRAEEHGQELEIGQRVETLRKASFARERGERDR
jgi:hypothetical protein